MTNPAIPEPIAAALGLRATTELRGLVVGARPELSVVTFHAAPEKLAVVGVLEGGAWLTWQLCPCGTEEEAVVLGHGAYKLVRELLDLRAQSTKTAEAVIKRTKGLH